MHSYEEIYAGYVVIYILNEIQIKASACGNTVIVDRWNADTRTKLTTGICIFLVILFICYLFLSFFLISENMHVDEFAYLHKIIRTCHWIFPFPSCFCPIFCPLRWSCVNLQPKLNHQFDVCENVGNDSITFFCLI